MKRTKLNKTMDRISVRTPLFFWTHCWKCGDYYKREPMWYWRVSTGASGVSFRIYNCMACCPGKADVVRYNERYFGKHKILTKGEQHALQDEKLAAPLD